VRLDRSGDGPKRDLGFVVTSTPASGCSTVAGVPQVGAPRVQEAYEVTGMVHVASTRRAARDTVSAEAALEGPGRAYFITPLSFNAWGAAPDIVAGGAGSTAAAADAYSVIEIHSAQPVLVEVVKQPLAWLARAAVAHTIATGRSVYNDYRAPWKAGMGPVWTACDQAGMLVAAVNRAPDRRLRVTSTRSDITGVHVSRVGRAASGVSMVDVLPPLTASLQVTLCGNGTVGSSWSFSYSVGATGGAGEEHAPAVPARGLHAAFPLRHG
jgi:hypothetical protein